MTITSCLQLTLPAYVADRDLSSGYERLSSLHHLGPEAPVRDTDI